MKSKTHPQKPSKLLRFLNTSLVVLLATALFLPMNMPSAYAAPTSAEKQAEADEVSAKLAAAEQEMLQMRDNYFAAVLAHEEALAGMAEAQDRIDAAQAVIDETQERLGTRAAQMYRSGPLNFLDVLFGASTFQEFTTSWDMINILNQDNAALIQAHKDARAEAQAAHEEFTQRAEVAAQREADAEAIKVTAEALVAEQQALLDGLTAEVAELVAQEEAARRAAEAAAAEEEARNNPNNGPGYDIDYNAPDPPTGGYGDVVSAAASRIGCPYVWAATGPNSFDCSGLTSWCYLQSGRGWIGRTDSDQYYNANSRWNYSSGGAEPGDVLWWPGHVGIYAGGGSYIHAPLPGQTVCYSSWNINSAVVLRFY